MNATSSRAHTVVTIIFDQISKDDTGAETKKSSVMNLVDLAGMLISHQLPRSIPRLYAFYACYGYSLGILSKWFLIRLHLFGILLC